MVTVKELKVPLSCRINPQIKKEIEEEATENEVTTSTYLVSILIYQQIFG